MSEFHFALQAVIDVLTPLLPIAIVFIPILIYCIVVAADPITILLDTMNGAYRMFSKITMFLFGGLVNYILEVTGYWDIVREAQAERQLLEQREIKLKELEAKYQVYIETPNGRTKVKLRKIEPEGPSPFIKPWTELHPGYEEWSKGDEKGERV